MRTRIMSYTSFGNILKQKLDAHRTIRQDATLTPDQIAGWDAFEQMARHADA